MASRITDAGVQMILDHPPLEGLIEFVGRDGRGRPIFELTDLGREREREWEREAHG